MCGLIGISRTLKTSIPDARRFLTAGLVTIEPRGPHSTGMAWTRGKAKYVWHQSIEGKATHVARKLDLDTKARIHTAIGHTRYATHGPSSDSDNRHPVVCGHIVATHNGRVANHDELIDLSGVTRIGEVDSFAIPALLSQQTELGARHPIELLELLEGCAAIAWLNTEDTRDLHLARTTGRPLHLARTKRGDLVYASTEANIRRWSIMTGVNLKDITEVAEGTYMRIREAQIVEWEDFMPATEWTAPDTDLVVTHGRAVPRSPLHGITDLLDHQSEDWWAETERLLDLPREEL